MHAERMQKEEAEDLVTQAEEALIRVRKAKDAAEDSRQLLEQDVETLQSQVEQLTQRNEQLEAENERNKTYVAELSRQKARLSKLCGLRPARVSPGVSPRTSPLFNFKTSSTRSPASSKFKSPVSSSMSRPSSSTISRPSTSPSLRINATARSQAATSSPEASGGSICNTSYCPLITQNVLSSFAGDISPTSLSTPSPVSSPAAAASPVFGSTIQGSMTVISGSESMEKLTKKSHTIPASPDFGRHSKERAERQERKSCSPVPPLGGGNTPWKQERRLAEMAKRNQQMRSNIARAEQRSNLTKEEKQGDAKKKNLIRRSLDESKRRLSREKFILEQAASVPTFVAEALKKQMANKNGIHELNADKENVINCMSPPPAAVEISMEATKANVSMTGSAIKKSARLRRATISGPLREM